MKNKVLIRALIASLFAFMLYSANLRQIQHAKVAIVEPKTSKVQKKQAKEPKLNTDNQTTNSPKLSKKVTVEKGSQTSLVKKIEQVMGADSQYQVAVQDLNNSARYARLGTEEGSHDANSVMRLYILAAIYHLEQQGKIKPRATVKIQASDRVKGEKLLQTNMLYGIAYLRQAMMRGNKTAANALLRKAKKENVNQVAKKLGTKNTVVTATFTKQPVGKTTVEDLDTVLKAIYQGRGLKQQYAQLVLTGMHGSRTKLTSKLSGTIYSVGDMKFTAAIVQSGGHSYCISVWSNSQAKWSKLGSTVNNWFIRAR